MLAGAAPSMMQSSIDFDDDEFPKMQFGSTITLNLRVLGYPAPPCETLFDVKKAFDITTIFDVKIIVDVKTTPMCKTNV